MPYGVSGSGVASADWASDLLSSMSSCSEETATGELCTMSISIQIQRAKREGVPLQSTHLSSTLLCPTGSEQFQAESNQNGRWGKGWRMWEEPANIKTRPCEHISSVGMVEKEGEPTK